MGHRFRKHYTRDEARALLPQLRKWLPQLKQMRAQVEKFDQRLNQVLANGADAGGQMVNNWIRALCQLKELLSEFHRRDIQIKDLDRGLIDFPTILGGREVFLCWEQDEDDIEFWHDLDAGYAGRERLP